MIRKFLYNIIIFFTITNISIADSCLQTSLLNKTVQQYSIFNEEWNPDICKIIAIWADKDKLYVALQKEKDGTINIRHIHEIKIINGVK